MREIVLGVAATLALVRTGCPSREGSPASPRPAVVTVAPAAASAPVIASAATADPSLGDALRESEPSKWKPGEIVIARGRVSKLHAQHLTISVEGKRAASFDLTGNRPQTILYWKTAPTCSGDIEVTGTVVEVKGPSKRPGDKESKVDETYRELHIDVSSARCVD